MSKLNRKENTTSIKALWRAFYDEERDLFELFKGPAKGIDIIESVDGYYPEYTQHKDGNIYYPPKNIRIVVKATFDIRKIIMDHVARMKENYKAAWQAKNGQFTPSESRRSFPYPHRFPQFIDNASEIVISKYPAFRSQSISKKPFRIASRAINSDGGAAKTLFSQIALGFEQHGIRTYEKDGELFVNGTDILKANKAKRIQVREESGMAYKLRISYPHEARQERTHYGFIVINNDAQITHAEQTNDPARTIESKARVIDYDFLPDGMKMYVTIGL
jgi:hypothetical protein